jgi:hypothetical protein
MSEDHPEFFNGTKFHDTRLVDRLVSIQVHFKRRRRFDQALDLAKCRQVLDCGSPLPLFKVWHRNKAAEGCRSPRRYRDDPTRIGFVSRVQKSPSFLRASPFRVLKSGIEGWNK